jgi:subtilisin family serine protease
LADARELAQIDLITGSIEDARVWPDDWRAEGRTVDYIYRADTILAREADAPRVAEVLPGVLQELSGGDNDQNVSQASPPPARGEPRNDVVDFSWAGLPPRVTVPAVMGRLDEILGAGVARPEHLLFLCYACPATEPMEVGPQSRPTRAFPRPRWYGGCCCDSDDGRGGGTGHGIKVTLIDSGLVQDLTSLPWMTHVTGDSDGAVNGGQRGDGPIDHYGGHGTFGAGCAAVMAPDAEIRVAGTMQAAGASYERGLADAVRQVIAADPPDVLVFTWASKSRLGQGMHAFEALYQGLLVHHPGIAVLAPAGNDGLSTKMYPAAYRWVTAVGALDSDCARLAHFSNRGSWVDVSTPGTDLVNAFANGEFTCIEDPHKGELRRFFGMARWSGTSFSTPIFAGMVAARASARKITGAAAAAELVGLAQGHAVPGIGPLLIPG